MAHAELRLRERRRIDDMLNAKIPVNKIAAEIGRHRATVYREIKRNRFVGNELPKLNGYALKSRHEGKLRPPTICDRLYGTSGKCPGWRTPTEAFREKLMEPRWRTLSQRALRFHNAARFPLHDGEAGERS
jgi:hypothetical protein